MSIRLAIVVAALVAALAGCGDEEPNEKTDESDDDVVVGMAEDRLPNSTASDWVTYADHVVVVNAASEEALPIENDEDGIPSYIPRTVTLEVGETLWSRAGAPHQAPQETFEWDALGWSLDDGGGTPPPDVDDMPRHETAKEDSPRLEPGHSYIMALVWERRGWITMGADSVLPYDENTIGIGELEGSYREEPAVPPAADPNFSFEDEMAGKTADDLATALAGAKPGKREDFG